MSLLDRIFGREEKEPEAIAYAQVDVGQQFKAFRDSDVGRYVIIKAEQEELDVLRRLAELDLSDMKRDNKIKAIQLQEEARNIAKLLTWIEEAINTGEAAEFQLEAWAEEGKDY